MAQLTHIPIFPTSKVAKGMAYYDYQQSLTVTAGAITSEFFSCNDLYDPDVTGAGHQPMGFDQMMLFYEHFVVTGARVSVTFVGSGADSCRVAVTLFPDSSAPSDPSRVIENGYTKMSFLEAKTYAPKHTTINLEVDVASYFAKKTHRDMLDDEKLTGAVTASPAEQVYFCISAWGGFAAANAAANYDIIISYDAIFFEPKKLTVS